MKLRSFIPVPRRFDPESKVPFAISAFAAFRLSLAVLILSFISVHLYASEPYRPTSDFKARWITADHLPSGQGDREGATLSNLWLTFRKEFSLEKVPEKALCRIACDSKYWLYVNGKQVVFEGQLKRGPTPKDTYFDPVDLSAYLKPGQNSIAVLMWFFGKEGFSHKNSGVPGFLFDASTNGPDGLRLLSDDTWKVLLYTKLDEDVFWKENPYSPFERITADPQPNFRLPESNIRYDARRAFPDDWTAVGFDDSAWQKPKVIGAVPVAPWNELYERPIPFWKDFGVKDYVNKNDIPEQADGKPIVCRLPYNAQITPILKIDAAEEGLCIDIRTDNYLGGSAPNVRSEYITKKGEQEYESLGWMSGHAVIYTIPAGVKILGLQYRETGYDTEIAGSFRCDDPFFNKLWEKSVRTLYITMRDTYFDCPDRERAQWWGDEVNELGEAFYALCPKSALLARKGMYELMWWQRENGAIKSPIPAGNYDTELPMQMLASIGPYGFGLWTITTGDIEPLMDLTPRIRRYTDLFHFGEDGVVLHRKGDWNWGDWGENIDLRVLTNTWYYMALETQLFGETLRILENRDKDAQEQKEHRDGDDDCSRRRKMIEDNFDKIFWNGKEYRDPAYGGETDDRANAMAVISGLAKEENFPAIREVLLREKHASPYMEKYVLEALFLMGYENDAYARMKERFQKMVDHEYTTLWEGWGIGAEGFGGGTINHAWSGGGLTMLSQYGAGVHLSEQLKQVMVCPMPGPLKRIESKTPSTFGEITVLIERTEKSFKLTVTLPPELKGEISMLKKYGKTLKSKPGQVETIDEEDAFLFEISSGTWTFETIDP